MRPIQAWETVCPRYQFFELFGKKWVLHIFWSIAQEYSSFSSLMKRVSSINSKVLSDRLDLLVGAWLVERVVSQDKPLKISYQLTKQGYKLKEQFDHLNLWIMDNPIMG